MSDKINAAQNNPQLTSERVARLRERLVEARPEVFAERALLVTEAYQNSEKDPAALCRARALDRILRKGSVSIKPDELIVGCKVPLAKGSPVYPEFNVEWLEDELDTLAGREETSFDITGETKAALKEQVIPYWKGRTVYDHISESAPEKALAAGDEGLLFHYYIDRSIGHISVSYEKVIKLGLSGIKAEIKTRQARLSEAQDDYSQKCAFYDALMRAADAAIAVAHR